MYQNGRQPEELVGWKQIASHLHVSVRTAQSFHKERGLPIHRRRPGTQSPVFAIPAELDRWNAEMWRLAESDGKAETRTEASAGTPSENRPSTRARTRIVQLVILCSLGGLLAWMFTNSKHPTLVGGGESVRLSASSELLPLPPLMTDGQNLYYQASDQVRYLIMRTSLAERSVAAEVYTPLANPDPGMVATDGSAILLRDISGSGADDQPLFIQPLPQGMPRRLGEIVAYDSAWTPDQQHIIFSKSTSVYEATVQGIVTRKLFEVPGKAHWFRWSPDGKILRFSVYDMRSGSYRIWGTRTLNTPPVPIPLLPFDRYTQQCCGSWSADGTYFVFQAKVNDFFQLFAHTEPMQLFAWFRHGDTIQLTTSGPVSFRSPLPVLRGTRLVALSQTQKTEVVQYESGTQRWLPLLDDIAAATADYSRDGQWLAYTRMPDHALFKCRVPKCVGSVQLTFPPLRITMPQWSPDGKYIACMVKAPGKHWQTTLIPSTGGPGVPIIDDARSAADPTWSPDGHLLAFGEPAISGGRTKPIIEIIDLSTKKLRLLPGSEGLNTPHWSRDGRFLAAVHSKSLELALYDFSTGTWWHQPGIRVGYLNWSADSSRIFFLALGSTTTQPAVMAVEVTRRKAVRVANLAGLRRPLFSFGDWVGIGHDDAPLAVRDLSTEDILSWRIERR